MNNKNGDWINNWINIIWNAAQTAAFIILHFQQNQQQTTQQAYDRQKLEMDARNMQADARNMQATMSEKYGAATERAKATQNDLNISKAGVAALGVLGGLLLFKGNKTIQKVKTEQNTNLNQVKNDLSQLKTQTDATLAQTQESLNKLANDLETKLSQTQENLNKVSSELQSRSNAGGGTAGGGTATGGQGGSISIDLGRIQDTNELLLENKIRGFVAPQFREIERKVERLNNKFIKLNTLASSSRRVTDSNTSQDSMLKKRLATLSLTYNEGTNAQYAGFIPQNESLVTPLSLTAPGVLQSTEELAQQQQALAKQMEDLRKAQAEVERIQKIQENINERLQFTPPESDYAIKMNPLPKDDPGDDNGGNPGLGAGTSQVEVNYLFISNNNFNLFPNSINLINTDKLINFNGFSSSKLIKPIVVQSSVSKPVAINNLHYLISKNTINYNLNDNLDNSCINTEHPVDITISNKSSTHPELINDIKLFNIITNDGSTVYNTSSIGDSTFGHRLNANQDIQPNRIINLNKHLFKNDNLESFSIADSDINQSVVENNNIIELCNIRQILHNKWLNSRLTSYPLIKDDFNQSLIEDIVDIKLTDDIIPILQTHDLTKTFIITKNLNINQYINIKKTNNTLCLNNSSLYIEPSFVSHALYLDFLDLVYCELFFNQQLINLNMSCFIYGSIFVPSLFILNSLGYLVLFSIFTTTFTLFNSGLDIILKTFLNKTNYSFIKNILNTSYSIVFNSIFFYIILLNISNVSVISNLILLKGTTLYGSKMLKDLHKSNNQYFKENIVINKALFINPYIYKNKMEL